VGKRKRKKGTTHLWPQRGPVAGNVKNLGHTFLKAPETGHSREKESQGVSANVKIHDASKKTPNPGRATKTHSDRKDAGPGIKGAAMDQLKGGVDKGWKGQVKRGKGQGSHQRMR